MDVEGTHTVCSRSMRVVFTLERSPSRRSPDAMLTAAGAHYELRGELWRGPWELWVASPEM